MAHSLTNISTFLEVNLLFVLYGCTFHLSDLSLGNYEPSKRVLLIATFSLYVPFDLYCLNLVIK